MREKQGFLSRVFSSNRDFDTTLVSVFVFSTLMGTVAAVLMALLRGTTVSADVFKILDVLENMALMILSALFVKSLPSGPRMNGQSREPTQPSP